MNSIKDDYRTAELDAPTRALLDACVCLSYQPWKIEADDIDQLRRHDFDDEAIHDAFQIAAYFNYINRVCDGLGIDLEDFMPPEPPSWKRDRP